MATPRTRRAGRPQMRKKRNGNGFHHPRLAGAPGHIVEEPVLPYGPVYRTKLGAAYASDSRELLDSLPEASVDLVVTSPPYALHFKKEYGNVEKQDYVAWFLPFAQSIYRALTPTGSFVLNIGGSYNPG